MKTVVTHSGNFHPDDVFAVAAFQLLLEVENMQVIRTRDDEVISSGDYVVDVGGVYDHGTFRYDHHQNGAPVRDNGIPYAAFGLMWKHHGTNICDSERVAEMVEERLCQPVDAGDNGVNLYELKNSDIRPYEMFSVIGSFRPVKGSVEDLDKAFLKAVDFAREHLSRLIEHGHESVRLELLAQELYEKAENKRIIVLDESIPENYFVPHPDVVATVYKSIDKDRGEVWKIAIVPTKVDRFDKRVSFPEAWLGLRDEELAKVSGIPDAIFCHSKNFRFVAASNESGLKATEFLV